MEKVPLLNKVRAYVDDVLSGRILSCEMVILACERWEDDWKRSDIYYDESTPELFDGFAHQLHHFKGAWAGKIIELEPWQLFVVANIFGWKRKSTGKRRYTIADVYVPRKNGKTTFAAIIGLFFELLDGEQGAEVYTAAVDKEQAKICFEAAKHLIEKSIFASEIKIYTNSIVYLKAASTFKPLSKDTKNKDGTNPSCAICDEKHAWKTYEIHDVIVTGMGARSQPFMFNISTAGMDTSYPYYSEIVLMIDQMRGIKQIQDNHFIMLYCPDEGDNWDDPNTWKKVNPNYGVSLSEEYMRNQYEDAKIKGGTTLVAFCTKNLNMWVNAPTVWIKDDTVKANNKAFDVEKLKGQECYVGIDLASKIDITAVSLFFPSLMVSTFIFYVPEEKVSNSSDVVDYRLWQEQGWLTVAPGKVLDEEWFMAKLFQELDKYDVKAIAYDPWGMWSILNKFGKYTDKLVEYQQSIRYMSVPTKWLESAVINEQLNFLNNPIIRWMFGNVVIYTDPNANIKLDKSKSRNKIDGVVALVDAIGGWLNKTSGKTGEIYQDHGLRTIPNN